MSKLHANPFHNFVKFTVRVGTPPELRKSKAGNPWATARVSVSMGKQEDGKTYKPSLWLTAKAFGQAADDALPQALANLAKGALVTLSGRLMYDEYETKEGEKRSDLSLVVVQIEPFEVEKSANGVETDTLAEFDPPVDERPF